MTGKVEELSSDTEATLPSAAEQAAAAKDRGTALFAQKSPEGYRGALEQYTSAIELTPDNHLLYANRSACYAGLAAKEWQPREKCELWAKALVEAKQCTELGPQWPKGFLRLATAQLELVDAQKGWEKRIADDRKWEAERKARKGTGTGDGDYTSPFVPAGSTPVGGTTNGPIDASTSSTAKKPGSAEEEEPAEVLSEAARAARAKAMEGDINAWRASTAEKVAEGIQADIADEALAKAGEEPFSDEDDDDDKYAHEHKPLPAELAAVVGGATFEACEASCRAGLTLDRSSQPLRELMQKLRDSGFSTDVASDVAMADTAAADVLKAEGNTKFAAKQFKAAITSYTSGLAQDPTNHVLYSNRSACFAETEEYERALADAEHCLRLAPKFGKGYSRHGLALYHLGRYVDAEQTVSAGLALDAGTHTPAGEKALRDLLDRCQLETKESVAFQKHIHEMRVNKRQDAKMKKLLAGLNMGGMGGNGVQMFNGLDGLLSGSGLGGAGGGFNMGGGGGMSAGMTEEQMRQAARAMADADGAS